MQSKCLWVYGLLWLWSLWSIFLRAGGGGYSGLPGLTRADPRSPFLCFFWYRLQDGFFCVLERLFGLNGPPGRENRAKMESQIISWDVVFEQRRPFDFWWQCNEKAWFLRFRRCRKSIKIRLRWCLRDSRLKNWEKSVSESLGNRFCTILVPKWVPLTC